MTTLKVWMFASFSLLVLADGFITDYILRFQMFAEANPVMSFAMEQSPLGMWTLKFIALAGLLVFWKRVTPTVLCVVCCGMAFVMANNCFWLANA